MLIIFAMLLTTIFTSSHGKYIDLLSEEQKQQFLNKIARRIMESVESSKTEHNLSIEFTTELSNQDSAQMRKRRADSNINEDESNAEENVELKNENMNSYKSDSSSTSEELSLVISEIKRRSYDEYLHVSTTDYTKTDKVTVDSPSKQENFELFNRKNKEPKPDDSLSSSKNQEIESSTRKINNTERPIKQEGISTTRMSNNFILEETNYTASTTSNSTKSGYKIDLNMQTENLTHITTEGHFVLNIDTKSATANVVDTIGPLRQNSDFLDENKATENSTSEKSFIKTTEYLNKTISKKSLKPDTRFYSYRAADDTVTSSLSTDTTSKRSIFTDLNDHVLHFPKNMSNISTTYSLPALATSYVGKKATKLPNQENNNVKVVPSTEFVYKEKQQMTNKKSEVTTETNTSIKRYQPYKSPWPSSSKSPPFAKKSELINNSTVPVTTYHRLLDPARKYSENFYLRLTEVKNSSYEMTAIQDAFPFIRVKNITNGMKRDIFAITEVKNNTSVTSKDSEIRKFGVYKKQPKVYEPDNPNSRLVTKVPQDQNSFIINKSGTNDKNRFSQSNRLKKIKGVVTTIEDILAVTDEKDVFPTLDILQRMDLNLMRRNDDVTVSIYLKALNDLIEQDSTALKRYDWLTTTVRIQSALANLFQLIQNLNQSKPINPADVEILKYIIFLHNFSSDLKGANSIKRKLTKQVKLLPRIEKKDGKILKEKEMIDGAWLYLRTLLPEWTLGDGLNSIYEFLVEIENALYDLHEAITEISKITKFKHQNWFGNLKQLYLSTNEKQLRELLLHISLARMVELIEHGCENGMEDDYIRYMTSHRTETKRTLEEMVFVSNVLDDIKSSLE